MRTLVVSDLHLGARQGDLLRDPSIRERLIGEIAASDTLVLLGDVLELRHRPTADVLEIATPFLREAADALGDGRILIVPGNHDYQLAGAWIESRRHDSSSPQLGLEQRFGPEEGQLGRLAAGLPAEIELAYPGAWLRPDIYATHGHYLDCHLTVPTFEAIGVSMTARILGGPLRNGGTIEDYESAQGPLYAFAYNMAQATRARRGAGANPSARVWAALHGAGGRRRLRKRLIGSVVVPGAVRAVNAVGLGPYSSDLSLEAIGRAGVSAMAAVAANLEIDAEHLIFGHTHRRGPLTDEPAWALPSRGALLNSGSWVHAPMMLGPNAATSGFWPGTCIVIEDKGPPRQRHLLEDLDRSDLRAADHGRGERR